MQESHLGAELSERKKEKEKNQLYMAISSLTGDLLRQKALQKIELVHKDI